jgi:hypothetical protein
MTISGVCTSTVCFSPSHFTGKERDTESGNDYFGDGWPTLTLLGRSTRHAMWCHVLALVGAPSPSFLGTGGAGGPALTIAHPLRQLPASLPCHPTGKSERRRASISGPQRRGTGGFVDLIRSP